MKQKVLFIILNEYTDWEGAFLSTALHVGVIPGGEIKYEVHTVAPTWDAVRSIGGFRTSPDYSFENMPKDYAALVLIGGNRWDSPEAELVSPLVQETLDNGKIVGAICNGASFLCSHGFLNNVKHTGNGLDQLKKWGGEKYTNEAGYVEAQAVSDKNIVTANGVGHLEFTREMLILLKANTHEQIAHWYDFYKNGFVRQ
ncbi:type 1 glutamine amidotransferase family protein [uncultured Porphyromonas sp.]|uniref:type 1 glutamine amidotransferase family protein n=1 Tax=uncultured Porphyromonas sp. TaxID=159274 RepID=UPI0025946137|nr:type 1 glutamine amidotransferase family protein [uncultured Porphyromonas sp.]